MSFYHHQFHVMAGPAELQLVGTADRDVKFIAAKLEGEARRIEKKYSRYDSESILSKINRSAGRSAVEVDDETAVLLDFAQAAFQQSDGLFDITSGVLRQVWDFKSARVPTKPELASVVPLIGWHKVEWKRPFFRLPVQGMEIDFGGFGKEYAVDRCVALAEASGLKSGLVNFAGDLRVIGEAPSGAPFRIGLVHPRAAQSVFASISVSKGAVATSGDYERFFEREGKRYCHILNPKTGLPVGDFQSITVFAEACLIAGTATTSAMLLGKRRGIEYLNDLRFDYIARDQFGKTLRSRAGESRLIGEGTKPA